jgi:hypothetical protein
MHNFWSRENKSNEYNLTHYPTATESTGGEADRNRPEQVRAPSPHPQRWRRPPQTPAMPGPGRHAPRDPLPPPDYLYPGDGDGGCACGASGSGPPPRLPGPWRRSAGRGKRRRRSGGDAFEMIEPIRPGNETGSSARLVLAPRGASTTSSTAAPSPLHWTGDGNGYIPDGY